MLKSELINFSTLPTDKPLFGGKKMFSLICIAFLTSLILLPIQIAPHFAVAGICSSDVDKQSGGVITGTLYSSDGETLSKQNAPIVLLIDGTASCGVENIIRQASVNQQNGSYIFTGLSAGKYRLKIFSLDSYVQEWWAPSGSVYECEKSQPVCLTETDFIDGIDFQLDRTASVSGTIYQTDGKTPVSQNSFQVEVQIVEGDPCGEYEIATMLTTQGGIFDGTYVISGIPPGNYYLTTRNRNNAPYAVEWYAEPESTIDCVRARMISLQENDFLQGMDFQMDPLQKGDFDSNGHVNLADAIKCLHAINGMSDTCINWNADVNGDNQIGIDDAMYILRTVTGLNSN